MVDCEVAVDDVAHTDKDWHFSHGFEAIFVNAQSGIEFESVNDSSGRLEQTKCSKMKSNQWSRLNKRRIGRL